MSLEIGIVGLPNAGKSTLFNALLKRQIAQVAAYPFTTVEPNIGVVEVPDGKLARLAGFKPQVSIKVVPASIKLIDIAGLVKDAHQGAGLGNQFLAKIREVDAILHIVRTFQNDEVLHLEGSVDPARDIEIVNEELKQADIDKPQLLVLNIDASVQEEPTRDFGLSVLQINAASPSELDLDKLIAACYKLLDLITVYTIEGEKIVTAWPVKLGGTVWEVARKIHSDFAEKFIKAEIISFEKLTEVDSYQNAKNKGLVEIHGRDYQVKDGDIATIKI